MSKTQKQKETAQAIVRKILDDLLDRRGFRQTWDGCDEVIKKDIRNALRTVTEMELNRRIEEYK